MGSNVLSLVWVDASAESTGCCLGSRIGRAAGRLMCDVCLFGIALEGVPWEAGGEGRLCLK